MCRGTKVAKTHGNFPKHFDAPAAAATGSVDPPRAVIAKEVAPREFYINKRDVEAHGHTKCCPGCRTMCQGGTREARSADAGRGSRTSRS